MLEPLTSNTEHMSCKMPQMCIILINKIINIPFIIVPSFDKDTQHIAQYFDSSVFTEYLYINELELR